jgi:pyruvate dehydrogenase E1 component alpha subunit
MNFAALWKLPVVWICENNLYGMGVPIAMNSAVQQITDKAKAYGVPAKRVDGMDVEAMYDAVKVAVEHARAGHGPYFIEAMTYRFRGHSMADPELYREKAEVEKWKKKDPLLQYRAKLEKAKVFKKGDADAMDKDVLAQVEAAGKFAVDSPFPDEATLYDHIYATPFEGTP